MRGLPIAAAFMGFASCAVALRAVEGAKALERDDRLTAGFARLQQWAFDLAPEAPLGRDDWRREDATRASISATALAGLIRSVPCHAGGAVERVVASLPALEAR